MNQTVIDYTYIQNTVWKIKAGYPAVRVCRIGKSVVGRSIYSLELGRSTAPAMLFVGTFMGQDAFTGELLLTWFTSLAEAVIKGSKINGIMPNEILSKYRVVIVPFLNPDGREICQRGAHCAGVDSGRIRRLSGGDTAHWDANARGVDITHNFDFRFVNRQKAEHAKGIYSPAPKGYGGTFPESEPETVAITSYCRKQPVQQAICLYSGKGQVFWRCVGYMGEKAEKQANILGLITGYEVEASVGCAVDTGFRNWFSHTFRKTAFDVVLDTQSCCEFYPNDPHLHEMLTLSCLF